MKCARRMLESINRGDLVEFYSSYENFMRDYRQRNPGIIISVRTMASVNILWSNGETTAEHSSYIRVINASR